MKTNIEFQNVLFVISAKLIESGVNFPFCTDNNLHDKYLVSVVCGESKIRFAYYDSEFAFQSGKRELNENDLKNAFCSFVSDAISGKMAFEDFCSEFGYEISSPSGHSYNTRSHSIWTACRRYSDKLDNLLPDDIDRYDLVNYLNE